MKTSEPLVLIVSGPSGSGKSTLVKKILELPNMMWSVSYTTRSPRATENERGMVQFHFRSANSSRWWPGAISGIRAGVRKELVRHAEEVAGQAPAEEKRSRSRNRRAGRAAGAAQAARFGGDFCAASVAAGSGATDSRPRPGFEDEIHRRLDRAREEMLSYSSYDFAVINDDLERRGRQIQAVAMGSRCKVCAERNANSGNFEVFWRLMSPCRF